jgi:hypothetical protein
MGDIDLLNVNVSYFKASNVIFRNGIFHWPVKKSQGHMPLEIQALGLDRHKFMSGLNLIISLIVIVIQI